jgi:hypothetical protein
MLFIYLLIIIIANALHNRIPNRIITSRNKIINKELVYLNFENYFNHDNIYFIIYNDNYNDIYNYLNYNNKTAILIDRKLYTDYEISFLTNSLNNFINSFINDTIIIDVNNNNFINNIYDL